MLLQRCSSSATGAIKRNGRNDPILYKQNVGLPHKFTDRVGFYEFKKYNNKTRKS